MDLIRVSNCICYWNFWGSTVKYGVSGKMKIHEKAENNKATHNMGNMGGSFWLCAYRGIF